MTLISGVRFFGTLGVLGARALVPKRYHLLNCLSPKPIAGTHQKICIYAHILTRAFIRRHYFKLRSTILGDWITSNIRRIVPPRRIRIRRCQTSERYYRAAVRSLWSCVICVHIIILLLLYTCIRGYTGIPDSQKLHHPPKVSRIVRGADNDYNKLRE